MSLLETVAALALALILGLFAWALTGEFEHEAYWKGH